MIKKAKTLLLVEDDKLLATTEIHWLKKAGYNTVHVLNGESAIETVKAKKGQIDLILMDINLGNGIDGTEAAKEILSENDIPLLFLSSHTEKEIVEKTEQITSYGYVVKDSNDVVLLASIKMAFKLHNANTELLAQRKALRISEEKFSKAFYTSPDSININRLKDGVYFEINDGFTQLTGYTANEVIGRSSLPGDLDIWVNKEDRDLLVKGLSEKGEVLNLEAQFRFKDGTIRVGLMSARILLIDDEKYILSITRDITDRKQAEESVRINEEKYRLLLELAPDPFFQGNTKGNFITVNNKACDLTGYTKEELLTMNMKDLFAEKMINEKPLRYDLLESGQTIRVEREILKKDGTTVPVEMNSKKMPDGTYQSFIRDISEHKIADQALNESESRYRELIEKMPDGVYKSTHSGKFLEVNSAMVKMLGYESKEELLAIDIKSDLYFQVEDRESAALEEKLEEIARFRLKKKDGSEIWVEDHGRHVLDEHGNILYHEGILRDISERKRAEDELLQRQYLMSSLMNTSTDHIYFKDRDSRFIQINNAMADLLNVKSSEEAYGKTDFDFFLEEHARSAYDDEQKIIETGLPLLGKEEKEVWHDGHVTWSFTSKFPLKDKKGEIVGTFGVSRDITGLKQVDLQLRQYADELKLANAAKDKFLSIISHDLKNPFYSINSALNLMLSEESLTAEERDHFLFRILNTSEKAYLLLENLLLWSRSQMGKIDFKQSNVELGEVVLQITELLKNSAYLKKISIVNRIENNCYVYADRNMLETVLRNLITNAIKFTEENGTIEIDAKINGSELELSIIDNGVGIAAEEMDKLFRIDTSFSTHGTKEETGTGLGLILCKEFVEKNNGKIWIESKLGNGTKVAFTLPISN